MAKTFRERNPDQTFLPPPSVKEFVPEGHPAHFVRAPVAEELELSTVMQCYRGEGGQPPLYDPVMMVALSLYPDFRTISDFSAGKRRTRKTMHDLLERLNARS